MYRSVSDCEHEEDDCLNINLYIMDNDDPHTVVTGLGQKIWMKNGVIHRDNKPAIIYDNDDFHIKGEEWWTNGKLHRNGDNEAVIINNNFSEGGYIIHEWWINGNRHRDNDQPAKVTKDAYYYTAEEWWVNGKRHRINRPAVLAYGGEEWWVNGEKHRIDGPAVTCFGNKEWWVNGVLIRKELRPSIKQHRRKLSKSSK